MTSGSKQDKISKRLDLISSIEAIVKESIYYRTHSPNFKSEEKHVIFNIKDRKSKKKIL